MITRKYNLINNVTGWIVFAVALVTYWLTLEPTASYWDCGEFIIQADKLEVGHPPGNPIFMLTARFFANFATDAASISYMVNAMSGLLSAFTILFLFWTITHLVRRLVVRDSQTEELSVAKYLVIIGSGVAGALAYTWSDTFWFSAVEGEVYAFSSFCTAIVFWLILKWENRADSPDSDRYLILIAYIIGVSIAVHLLNLLCIPAIVLVFAYRKWSDMNLTKSLLALLLSFVMIVLVLFGLVPGFIKMAQRFELFFVNTAHMSFNSGALIYAFVTAAVFIWTLFEIRAQRSQIWIKVSFFTSVLLSGILFLGSGWWLGWVLTALLLGFLVSKYWNRVSLRAVNVIMWSIAVIFVGYSSYALILIRSSADTPMNQNSPDNVFDLATYLSREQYGETPLLYGQTLYSGQQKKQVALNTDTVSYYEDGSPILISYPTYSSNVTPGRAVYAKGVRGAEPQSEYGFLDEGEKKRNRELSVRGGDYYVLRDHKPDMKLNPELDMIFPRIYSSMHRQYYQNWVNLDTVPSNMKELYAIDEETGHKVPEVDMYSEPFVNPNTGTVSYPQKMGYRPTYAQNLAYFFNYQLIHMYMRYFMWNFAGRQNDILNQQGELDAGNWISGIPFIDNMRLGDQSLLPAELGEDNPGHNKFYLLPLILGLLGLIWQAFAGKRGIEQFWVIFFLFFMTGIAIVLYLNQPPMQPRERDYAYAGSFYAFAIWIGMGVAALWWIVMWVLGKRNKGDVKSVGARNAAMDRTGRADVPKVMDQNPDLTVQDGPTARISLYAAAVAAVIGLAVPLQMVSQTWDDHDRSRRTAARDFAINYLESLEPNAIVFCNGDNDTFPLWYAQEVEGVRPDVKIVNLSYLASDWYANQMRKESYTAAPIDFTAKPENIAYGNLDVVLPGKDRAPVDLLKSLKFIYEGGGRDNDYGYAQLPSSVLTIPVDKKAVVARGLIQPKDTADLVDEIVVDLGNAESVNRKGYVSLSELLMLDIIATNAAKGWPRPIYWCMSVGNEYHLGMSDYMRGVGMTHQLVPTMQAGLPARTDRAYDVVMKYKWGGADNDNPPYFDETARRMLISTRTSMLDVATELVYEGDRLTAEGKTSEAGGKYRDAIKVMDLMESRLRESTWPYSMSVAMQAPEIYGTAGQHLGDEKAVAKARAMIEKAVDRLSAYVVYNMYITRRFGQNIPLTTESRYMPYQLYKFVEMYGKYGGDLKKMGERLRRNGLDVDQLRRQYESLYGGGAAAGAPASDEDMIGELSQVAAIVNRLAAMGPDEYAGANADERLYDSIFFEAYRQYSLELGVEKLNADPEISRVDMARSERLYKEYEARHPQQ